jgi:hypothetical protein
VYETNDVPLKHNDEDFIVAPVSTRRERESRIRALFAKHGVKVTFTGRYP